MEATLQESTTEQMHRIEVNRRKDVALGLLQQAARLFETRKELQEQIGDGKKALASKWYWVIGLAGIAAHYVFSAQSQFSFGVVIAAGAYLHWMARSYEQGRLAERHRQCNEKLGDLEAVWTGATGYSTFWSLERFAEFGQIDIEDDAFQEFWGRQMQWIRERVGE